MATLKPTTNAAIALSQTARYATELQRIKDSHEPRLKALVTQAEETKATCLSLGLSEEAYNSLRNLFTRH